MHAFKQRIKDQFLQTWKTQISSGNKLAFYSITCIKFQHCLENYLNILKISKFRNALSSLRVSCHSLEIEKGRHRGEERENRKCRVFPQFIEHEYHFILICKEYDDLRRKYLNLNILYHQMFTNFLFLCHQKMNLL